MPQVALLWSQSALNECLPESCLQPAVPASRKVLVTVATTTLCRRAAEFHAPRVGAGSTVTHSACDLCLCAAGFAAVDCCAVQAELWLTSPADAANIYQRIYVQS
jgi:hypothetical protein